jgi:hypothetical protein
MIRFFHILCFIPLWGFSQSDTSTIEPFFDTKYIWIGEGVSYAGTMVTLNQLWYAHFEHSSAHWFDDGKEWLQMDKMGHGYSAYQLTRISHSFFSHSTVSSEKALLYSSISSWIFMSSIECFDAFSSQWGASTSDILANTIGVLGFAVQQSVWHTQRFRLKFSYHPTSFPPMRPSILGTTFSERLLKDYNGQTYWISASPHHLFYFFPSWLAVSAGYSATGLLGGKDNPKSTPYYKRQRQWLLSLDIDLQEIPTKNKYLKTLFGIFNTLKIPMPTLMLSEKKLMFKPLYF